MSPNNSNPPKIKDEIFSGIINDSDVLKETNNYIILYHFKLIDAHFDDNKCMVKAELGIGARMGCDDDMCDLQSEKKQIQKEYAKLNRLAKTKPDDTVDGVTNAEIARYYKKIITGLNDIPQALIPEIKEQIKERINPIGVNVYGEIFIEQVKTVPFNIMSMKKAK